MVFWKTTLAVSLETSLCTIFFYLAHFIKLYNSWASEPEKVLTRLEAWDNVFLLQLAYRIFFV